MKRTTKPTAYTFAYRDEDGELVNVAYRLLETDAEAEAFVRRWCEENYPNGRGLHIGRGDVQWFARATL